MKAILISDPLKLRSIIDFANRVGAIDQLGRDLVALLTLATNPMIGGADDKGKLKESEGSHISEIGCDFAPMSMSFVLWRGGEHAIRPRSEWRSNAALVGGFIYAGPGSPGDGSAPAFSVDLAWVTGQRPHHSWNLHT
jgi:hypothetical protein